MADGEHGRHGWVVLVYFFAAALISLMVLMGAIEDGARVADDGNSEQLIAALIKGIAAAVVFVVHLREGLRRSRWPDAASGATPAQRTAAVAGPPAWPAAVYWYLAALVGLIVLLIGASSLADAIAFSLEDNPGLTFGARRSTGESIERTLLIRGTLLTIIGAIVMWWHLREARRTDITPGADRS